jgi:hypothetical protein
MQMKVLSSVVGGLASLVATSAFADPGTADPYLNFSETPKTRLISVETAPEEIRINPEHLDATTNSGGGWLNDVSGDLDMTKVILDQVINIGKTIWNIVEAGKPVVNFNSATANALPSGVRDWTDLQGWKAPRAYLYETTYQNFYGMDVVKFSYRVVYTYGGNIDGKGAYLAQVSVQPAKIDVMWGYTFDADVTVPSVTNAGTRENPVGAAQLVINWKVNTVLKDTRTSQAYYMTGLGEFSDLDQ